MSNGYKPNDWGNLPTWKTRLPPWQWCDRLRFHVLSGSRKFSEGSFLYTCVHLWKGLHVTKTRAADVEVVCKLFWVALQTVTVAIAIGKTERKPRLLSAIKIPAPEGQWDRASARSGVSSQAPSQPHLRRACSGASSGAPEIPHADSSQKSRIFTIRPPPLWLWGKDL